MSCLRDVQEYFFPQWAQNLVSRPFFLLSTTKNLADASVRGFTGLVNTAVCVWYVGGYVTQLRPAHNQIHQLLALGGLGGRLKTGHTWTLQRVFRTFGGGFTESGGIGNRKWTDEHENPGWIRGRLSKAISQ